MGRRGAVAVVALAAYVVAVVRRHNGVDVAAAFLNSGLPLKAKHFDVFDPFRPGHGYLWLGIAVGLTVTLVVLAFARRGERRVAVGALAVGAVGSAVVTLVQRHDSQLERREFEAAYFSGGGGDVSYSVGGTNLFDPFTPLDAYLWLGLAVGFAVGAFVAALPQARNPRRGRE